jgi:glyoxylase-like metal-dependent hydrolase (beta-lactamase superfamily II)
MRTYKTKSGHSLTQVLGGRSNVYLLTNGYKNLLIDASRKYSRDKLISNLRSIGVRAIDYLVLTHTHFDHAENAEFLKRNYNTKVFVQNAEAGFLAKGKSPLPKGSILLTKILVSLFANKLQSKVSYMPCDADIIIEERRILAGFGFSAELLHTPGHSVGSMSLIIDDEIAVVGDALFGVIPHSIFPPFADDVKEVVNSWGKLLDTKCKLFLPMHGLPRTRKLVEKCYKARKI